MAFGALEEAVWISVVSTVTGLPEASVTIGSVSSMRLRINSVNTLQISYQLVFYGEQIASDGPGVIAVINGSLASGGFASLLSTTGTALGTGYYSFVTTDRLQVLGFSVGTPSPSARPTAAPSKAWPVYALVLLPIGVVLVLAVLCSAAVYVGTKGKEPATACGAASVVGGAACFLRSLSFSYPS